VLFDLRYCSWTQFTGIVEEHGRISPRLKSLCNGVSKKVRRGTRGPVGSGGRRLQECIAQGRVSDRDIQNGQGKECITLRTIRIFDRRTREKRWYVTNLSPKDASAKAIAELYRLRWQVEMLFKELKSDVVMDDLRSKREEVTRCHSCAALITAMLSRFLCAEATPWGDRRIRVDSGPPVTKSLRGLASFLGRAAMRQGHRDLRQILGLILETAAVHTAEPSPGRTRASQKRQRKRA